MNERIKELAEQCESFGSWDNKTYTFDKEKFAELIVLECVKLNTQQFHELMGVITDVEEGNGFDDVCLSTVKRVADNLTKELKEHFGVE